MALSTMNAPQQSNSDQAAESVVIANPFPRAAYEHIEPMDSRSQQLDANSHQKGPIDVPPYGFARHLVITVTGTGGTGGSGVSAEDGPFDVLQDLMVTDVNGRNIVGPYSGSDLYLANLVGGYVENVDPKDLPSYSAVDANGNFSFKLRVPFEITSKDGLGSLPNMNSSATYKLSYTIGAASNVYDTEPATTLASVSVVCHLEAWTQPGGADGRGNPNVQTPPMVGTTQYWTKSQHNVSAGEQRIPLPRKGNMIRNLVFIFRDGSGDRDETNLPSTLRVEWDGRILTNTSKLILKDQFFERFGVALPAGMLAFDYTHDADGKPGNENRHLWLPTSQATRMELVGSFGGAGVLTILTNDVQPQG